MSTDDSTAATEAAPPKRPFWVRLRDRLPSWRRKPLKEKQALALPPMTRGMQTFSMLSFFVLGAAISWFAVANPFDVGFLPQGGSDSSTSADDQQANRNPSEGEGSTMGAVYQCPMHPQVVQDHADDCPICGMALVEVKEVATGSGEREVLYWYAPMDATYVSDEPGLSPMGMKLVPKYADEDSGSEEGVIRIDPVQVQNIGVVSVQAEMSDIARQSRTVGILDFNADEIVWINTKFEGWIETVHINYVGEDVKKGQALFEIYSPELVTTQEEYLRALEYKASLNGTDRPGTLRQAESLVRSTRDRLEYWDITDEQIRELEKRRQVQRRLTVTSPADGVVAEVMSESLEGMFVKPGMDLYKIVDLSSIWVHADIYEQDIPWVRDGQPAVVSFRNAPQQHIEGKILFLYPEVSRDTRTLKICVEVANPDSRLRPGMYADVVIQGPTVRSAVTVPQSAVIRSGQRNLIFVDLGEGRFEPREVVLGITGEGDRIQVTDGIATGEAVVTQAQFMLDSESRIQEAIAQFRNRGKNTDQADAQPAASGHGQ